MSIPKGRAEELRRRLRSGWPIGLPNPQLRKIAQEAIEYAAELEAECAQFRRMNGDTRPPATCDEAGLRPGGVDCQGCARCSP